MRANRILISALRQGGRAFAGIVAMAGALSCGPRGGEHAADPAEVRQPAPAAAAPTAGAAPAFAPAVSYERLVGGWLRADGGYVLEIRSVSPDGAVDASYLNPRPIRVARATASRGGDFLTLLVELRDVNYPGSTYRLWYDPGRDVLEGTYFQAVERQTYDVSFVRQSP